MTQYRKKPVVIDAWRYPGHSIAGLDALLAFEEWFESKGGKGRYIGQNLHVLTLEDGPNSEAKHVADPGDWIICGVAGELYPCKPAIFDATYEDAALSSSPQVEAGDDWELEIRAFQAANDDSAPQETCALVKDLWKAYCDMQKRAEALRPREQEGGEAPVDFAVMPSSWAFSGDSAGQLTDFWNRDDRDHESVSNKILPRAHPPLPADGWKEDIEAAFVRISELRYSEAADPLDDACDIADKALAAIRALLPTPPASTEGGADD